jgi:alpha-tubulin suppressor-like RCC1 family protein
VYDDADDKAVAAKLGGRYFSLLLTESGRLWASGENYYGQQGTGDDENSRSSFAPVKAPNGTDNFENAIAMDAGYTHGCVIDDDNIAYTFGDNHYSALGLGNDTPLDTHVLIPTVAETPVSSGELGWFFSAFLCSDGTIKTAGYNHEGQLGRIITDPPTPPYSADFSPALTDGVGNPALGGVTQLSSNYYTLLALCSDGTVWGTGDNQYGQIGDDTTSDRTYFTQTKGENGIGFITDVKHIASGRLYSLMVKENGELWTTGAYWSNHGTKTPVKLMEDVKIADINRLLAVVKTEGTVWTGEVDEIDELTQVIFDDPE